MTKLIFVGQAPSRVGDGRAFSGPSGRRLAALLGLRDYEELQSQCYLANIFKVPAVRRPLPARRRTRNAPGDEFDAEKARELGRHLMVDIAEMDEHVIVVACGHQVFIALTGQRAEFFKGRRVEGVEVWCFPHPSGASQYWNYPANKLRASNFLKRLLKRSGVVMA